MKIDKQRIKKILEMPGISGREFIVSDFLEEHFKKNKFTIERDNLGSLIAIKKSKNKNAKKVLFDAHMDEVGFMVTDLTHNGLIKFEEHGYINKMILPTQRVRVWNKNLQQFTIGVIGNIETKLETTKVEEIEKMFIDVGATSKQELKEFFKIELGNTITFDGEAIFNNKRVLSKAADDRVGISLLCDLADYAKDKEFDFDLILSATVQEEVGLRGARTVAYKIKPDKVVTIDTSPSHDFPTSKNDGDLGKGTFLRHQDRGYITSLNSIEFLRKIMDQEKIKYQDYFSQGGTNAFAFSTANSGLEILPIGLLVRNIHSGTIIFDLGDYEETQKLLLAILNNINF